jgi:tRNA nucleotidyltransferase/poly(A) polymerase
MTPREFAIDVVIKLQQAGFQALWAGGCVRDQLLGLIPKDYDVATNATPEQVRDTFGRKRTLPIGASFGVITVLGQKRSGPVEVATFRRDSGYSDGRHPDSVEFTDAQEDARRRDFTINGIFFDPVAEDVIDYVGGQADLAARVVRAIGCPEERIDEDKLRMLRGVRFASTFNFELDRETLTAIQKHAPEIRAVSGERIGAEMRRMLAGANRANAAELLRISGLMAEIISDCDLICDDSDEWERIVLNLQRLEGDFESAAAILLQPILKQSGSDKIVERWKLSNSEQKSIDWIAKNWVALDQADQLPWSQVQPLLLHSDANRALAVAASQSREVSPGVEFCRNRLQWPKEKLDPEPLLDGSDLIGMGIDPGPLFKQILDAVRVAQLENKVTTMDAAKKMAQEFVR